MEGSYPYIHGVPEELLSDRDTNLLSFLMKQFIENQKLNTTAYHS